MLRLPIFASKGFRFGGRGSFAFARRWFGTMFATWSNQKCESWVSTSPLRGMPLGITQSKAGMRSEATNRKESPRSKISRTLPLFSLGIPGSSRVKTGSFTIGAKYANQRRFRKSQWPLKRHSGTHVLRLRRPSLRGDVIVLFAGDRQASKVLLFREPIIEGLHRCPAAIILHELRQLFFDLGVVGRNGFFHHGDEPAATGRNK